MRFSLLSGCVNLETQGSAGIEVSVSQEVSSVSEGGSGSSTKVAL